MISVTRRKIKIFVENLWTASSAQRMTWLVGALNPWLHDNHARLR